MGGELVWPSGKALRPVLNWRECFFANLVGSIRPSYIRGPKNLRSTCSGNIRPIGRSLPPIG